jgi:predicted MFS family arabinose efflux permease
MSFGFHFFETTNQSLTLQYFNKNESPWVFGRLRSISAATNVTVGLAILILNDYFSYKGLFSILGILVFLSGIWALFQNPTKSDAVVQKSKLVFKWKYWLFYTLRFLAGARRQIFVAFADFLLVKKFGFSVAEITTLFITNNTINYFLSPTIGRMILKYGERFVLSLEYLSVIIIFVGYAFVDNIWVLAGLYIVDQIFLNFAIAINTYFQKVADPEDIAPGMAVSFTINHIAAVIIPVTGGILWMIDYRIPFSWEQFKPDIACLCSVYQI